MLMVLRNVKSLRLKWLFRFVRDAAAGSSSFARALGSDAGKPTFQGGTTQRGFTSRVTPSL